MPAGEVLPHEVRGSGHPLVLIHADSVDRRLWDYQIDAFAEFFRVVRYDLRNLGAAPRYTGAYDAGQDLLDLLGALDIGTAHLVGAGVGSSIALDCAFRHPQRVSALVLVAPVMGQYGSPQGLSEFFAGLASMTSDFMGVLQGGDPAPFIDRIIAEPHNRPSRGDSRELLRRMLLDNAHVFTHPSSPRPSGPLAADRLGEIVAPTLVVVGERDMDLVKGIASTLQQGIRGATKLLVPGAGNFPNLDDPDFFNEKVLQFLTAIGTPSGGAP